MRCCWRWHPACMMRRTTFGTTPSSGRSSSRASGNSVPRTDWVPMNGFQRQWQDTREDALRAFTRVGESGWYITGKELAEFEQALASLWTLEHCAGVASGLDAIEIALKALGCRPGDRVLTTPLSAFATTLAIAKLGAVPVFVDTDAFGLIDL